MNWAIHGLEGARSQIEDRNGLPYFINEFWTAKQRQAHRIHEVSYRACFKAQLPAFFIERLTEVGDIVYDPFMGRGTTPIEAALRGRIPFGNDVNPLSRALTEPRIHPPELSSIEERLAEIPWGRFKKITRDDLLVFYHPRTLAQIEGLQRWLQRRERDTGLDPVDQWIRMVALNRLTGHSKGFFSVYTLPPNQAVSVDSQRKINEKRGQTPEFRDVPALLWKKSKRLLSAPIPKTTRSHFLTGRSEDSPTIPDGAVALTVTSPPFLDIVNYEADNWLRCWFIGIDPKTVSIASLRSVEAWRTFTHKTLAELCRITKLGGHIAYEVGAVRNGTVPLERVVAEAADGLPLQTQGVLVNRQAFTKTANCWGVKNNEGGVNDNRIVVFKRV